MLSKTKSNLQRSQVAAVAVAQQPRRKRRATRSQRSHAELGGWRVRLW